MPKSPRLDYPDARHHVMNRGACHAPIFFDHDFCGLFNDLLGEFPSPILAPHTLHTSNGVAAEPA